MIVLKKITKPIPNIRAVLLKAWSVRLIVAAVVLSALEVALPIIDQIISIPRGIFAAASSVTAGGAFWARLVAQKGVTHEE